MSERPSGWAGRVRLAGWVFFGIIAFAELVLQSSAVPLHLMIALTDAFTYLLPILLAAITAGTLMAMTRGIERRFWALLGGALALLFVSEAYWTWYTATIDPRGPRIPAAFELLQLGAAALFFALVIAMTTFGSARPVSRVRFYLDAAGGLIVVGAALYWFVTLPMFAEMPRAGWPVAAIAALYLVLGALMVTCSLALIVGWRPRRWRAWERFIGPAILLYGVGLIGFPSWSSALLVTPESQSSLWFDLVLGFGYYLLFMAGVYRLTGRERSGAVQPWPVNDLGMRWVSLAYPIALAAALPVMGWAALATGGEPQGQVIVWSTLALAFVLIARSWLVGVERSGHRTAAVIDPVSGAYNHRHLHERLAADIAELGTNGPPLAVTVFDIEDFRALNASEAHAVCDEILGRIVEILLLESEAEATVCRLGGDEFAVVMPETDAERAVAFAMRVRERIAREIELTRRPVTVSAGVAIYPLHGTTAEEIIARAVSAQQLAAVADESGVLVYDEEVVGASAPRERLERARRRSHRATVRALAAAVDARDPDTRHHSESVAELASALAVVLDMSPQQSRTLELAAQMHDVGLIGVRDDVLRKAKGLTADERRRVEEHPVLGERILAPAGLDEILPAVRHHHERWDGTGYPDGLAGYDIPFDARVLAVCDAFDALTSSRGARGPLSASRAIVEIVQDAGARFDPEIAQAFARMVGRLQGATLHGRMAGEPGESGA